MDPLDLIAGLQRETDLYRRMAGQVHDPAALTPLLAEIQEIRRKAAPDRDALKHGRLVWDGRAERARARRALAEAEEALRDLIALQAAVLAASPELSARSGRAIRGPYGHPARTDR